MVAGAAALAVVLRGNECRGLIEAAKRYRRGRNCCAIFRGMNAAASLKLDL
jgi:hypothetical protein